MKIGNFYYGERVKLIHAVSPVSGRVVAWRGPLGPRGTQVYRIMLRRKPIHAYVEVLEEQMESLEPELHADEIGQPKVPLDPRSII